MRIAIVNDLALAVEALARALARAPEHEVAWIARTGAEAVERCRADLPDLILMDLAMPGIDGVEATRRIMRETPCAILVVTASVGARTGMVYEALGAGALDAIDTPALAGADAERETRALLARIATVGKIMRDPARPAPAAPAPARAGMLIALGASAGGPVALAEVLKAFPAGTPAAVVAVTHLDRRFAAGLVDWLGKQIALPARLARRGERPEPGVVLLPGREDHLILEADGTLAYTRHPIDDVYRPSVDLFFASVAAHWRGKAAAALLTGMGRDGARGLLRMREAGFATFAQDQATSAVYGMPKAAAQLGAAEKILPLSQIGPALQRLVPPATP